MDETRKGRRLKDIVDQSQYWDAEFLLRNLDEEMIRLENGLDHMVWDSHEKLVTACVRPLPIAPRFEVDETSDEFTLKVYLPDIPRENVRLNVDGGSVEVIACKDDRVCRPYYVRVDSSSALDPDTASAEFAEGVLKARVQKVRKKRLEIRQS